MVGKLLFKLVNLGLEKSLLVIAKGLPKAYENRIRRSFPILRDYETFTERFLEPLAILVGMVMAYIMGQPTVGFWLMVSFSALTLVTGERHESERAYVLDVRDQMIEARAWQKMILGQPSDDAKQISRTLNETMKEVEKTPEILEAIRENQPKLADAIAAIRAKKNKPPVSPPDSPTMDAA